MKWLYLLLFVTLPLGQLGAIPIFAGVTIYAHDLALVLLLIFSRKKEFKGRLRYPIVFFIWTAVVSLLANAYRFPASEIIVSSLYLVRWMVYASIYFVIQGVSPKFLLKGLYVFGVALSGLGIVQYFLYPYLRNLSYLGWDPHLFRVFSTLLDPNFAGLIFILTLFLGAKQKYPLITQGITLAAFFLTFSRSSYLAFLVGITLWLFATKKAKYIVAVVTIFLLVLVFLPKPDGEGVKLFRTVSTFARIGNWQRGLTLISQPRPFGHGFNTLRYEQRERGWVDDSEMISKAGAGLDNSLLFVLATTGILGFAAYIWLLWIQFKIKSLLLTTTLVAVIVHSMFSNSLFYPWVMVWMWILTAAEEGISAGS